MLYKFCVLPYYAVWLRQPLWTIDFHWAYAGGCVQVSVSHFDAVSQHTGHSSSPSTTGVHFDPLPTVRSRIHVARLP